MTREETKKTIEIMQAYVDGNKIEVLTPIGSYTPTDNPSWDWGDNPNRYKVAPTRRSVENEIFDLCRQNGKLFMTQYYDVYEVKDLDDVNFIEALKKAFKDIDFNKAPKMHTLEEVVDFICKQCNIE